MGSDDQMIWLEASGCWARVPREPKRPIKRTRDTPNKRQKHEGRRHASPDHSGDKAAHARTDVECTETTSLCCSICLDEVSTHDKAVTTPCMHEYHHTCISKWLTMKQECPLCKSPVHSVLYNIQEDGSFLERELNLPLKHVTNREDIMRRLAEILGEGLNELVRYQVGRREENRNFQTRRDRNERTSASLRNSGAGPSPYSMRVQRHANNARSSDTLRTPPPPPTIARSHQFYQNSHNFARGQPQLEAEEEVLIAWRREIYDLDLWAIPLGTHHHVPRSLVAPAGRQNRIKEWVHRELQALLETEHTTILRGFVMGLLATYGAHPPLPPSRLPPAEILAMNGAETEVEGPRDDPISQLRPFLGSAAAHFWHKLSCFATAPAYTIRTYDSIVRYARPGEPIQRQDRGAEEENTERRRERRGAVDRGREQERDLIYYNRRDKNRRRRQRGYSRSRSRSRVRSRDESARYHRSNRRRRREEEEEEGEHQVNYGLCNGPTRVERQGQGEEESGESRWELWKWGDPVYE